MRLNNYSYTVNPRLSEPGISGSSIIRITKFAAHVNTRITELLNTYIYVHMCNASSVASACSFCSSAMAECVATTITCAAKPKRKRTVLSIEDKVAIIKQLESSSARVIAELYGVAKSTISDIKKNRDKILHFKQETCDMGMSKKAKVMKLGDDAQHDKGVYLWFKQKRTRNQDEQEFVCEFQELG